VGLLSVHFLTEFLVEGRDDLLRGHLGVPSSTAAIRSVRLSLPVAVGLAHLGEMRLSSFLVVGTQGPVRFRATRISV
jgi:hypothetical protein